MKLASGLPLLAFAAGVQCSRPTTWYHKLPNEKVRTKWVWGLGWGLGDAEVSVVDREPIETFASRLAFFGGRVTQPGMLGYILPLSSFTVPCAGLNDEIRVLEYKEIDAGGDDEDDPEPNTGCPKLCIPGPHPRNNETWFALVQRGECAFVYKVREAQRLGARAVIVGGSPSNRDELISMYSNTDASDITVPATYITYASYSRIMTLLSTSTTTIAGLRTLSILLTSDPAWEWYSPVLTFLLLLLLPSMLTMCTLLIHRIRTARAERQERAPEDFVNSLPTRVWNGTGWEKDIEQGSSGNAKGQMTNPDKSSDRTSDGGPSTSATTASDDDELPHPHWFASQVECAICISPFERGDRVRILPCGHIFHLDEIDGWLIQRKKLCPVCKADVTLPPAAHPTSPHAEPLPQTAPLSVPNARTQLQEEAQASSSGSGTYLVVTGGSSPPNERTPLLAARASES